MDLKGKHIVVGITGSIAAYKACELIRLFVKDGAEVQVVITPAGKEFITPVTLSALTSHPVISDFFAQRDGTWHSHVDLGLWADAMVIAPCTASTLGKMAGGIADNMLITTYLAMKAPVFIAPAMDRDMYAHPSTQANLDKLRSYGNTVIEPTEGFLASKLIGKGRMEEPQNIFLQVKTALLSTSELKGKTVLITAGPTYEKIDPVRFIGNYSSGKMGFALAEACAMRGAHVELVSGPTSLRPIHPGISLTHIESAAQMMEAASRIWAGADVAILSAAVADFTPAETAAQKIKRNTRQQTLDLVATPDIAATLGQSKRAGQILVGFALETHDELHNAQEKLRKKHLDFIVLHSLQDKGAGFGYDTNKVTLVTSTEEYPFPLKSKAEVAQDIIDFLCTKYL